MTDVFFPVNTGNAVQLTKTGVTTNTASFAVNDTTMTIKCRLNGVNLDAVVFSEQTRRLNAPTAPLALAADPKDVLLKGDGDSLYVTKLLSPNTSTFDVRVTNLLTQFRWRNNLDDGLLEYRNVEKRWYQSERPAGAALSNSALATIWDVEQAIAGASGAQFGDIKQGMQSGDHAGWYLLDGRAVSTLPLTQRNRLINLGYAASNLPNQSGRMIAGATSTSDRFGVARGTSVLSRDNLPNVTISTSSNSAGTPNVTIGKTFDDGKVPQWESEGNNFATYKVLTTTASSGFIYAVGRGNEQVLESTPLGHVHSASATQLPAHLHSLSLNGGVAQQPYIAPQLQFNLFIYLGL